MQIKTSNHLFLLSDCIENVFISVSDESSKYQGMTAVVVGAGPAGATAAAYLAKHGFNVKARSHSILC